MSSEFMSLGFLAFIIFGRGLVRESLTQGHVVEAVNLNTDMLESTSRV